MTRRGLAAVICSLAIFGTIISVIALTATAQAEEPSANSCVAATLARPTKVGAYMIRPGNKAHQELFASATFSPISADCVSVITRKTPTAVFEMQRPKNHKHWIRTPEVAFVEAEFPFHPIGNGGGSGDVTYRPKPPIKKFLYRCTPGSGVTQARVVITVEATSVADLGPLGEKSYSWPVRLERLRTPIPGTLNGPC